MALPSPSQSPTAEIDRCPLLGHRLSLPLIFKAYSMHRDVVLEDQHWGLCLQSKSQPDTWEGQEPLFSTCAHWQFKNVAINGFFITCLLNKNLNPMAKCTMVSLSKNHSSPHRNANQLEWHSSIIQIVVDLVKDVIKTGVFMHLRLNYKLVQQCW